MPHPLPLLVFTDLDGTLLSHADYSYDAARPALSTLKDLGAGIVLASSKTAAEIAPLRAELGLQDWPAIVENGAGLLAPNAPAPQERADYVRLREVLDSLPKELREPFRGFGDMDAAQVSEATGLSEDAAGLAKDRAFSEPGLWSGRENERTAFIAALSAQGVTARQGGRFWTLSFGRTKASQMEQIIARVAPRETLALGDAPNDVEMLEAADFGVIVANPHRPPLPRLTGEDKGRITRTDLPGPQGWNAAIAAHLARPDLQQG